MRCLWQRALSFARLMSCGMCACTALASALVEEVPLLYCTGAWCCGGDESPFELAECTKHQNRHEEAWMAQIYGKKLCLSCLCDIFGVDVALPPA